MEQALDIAKETGKLAMHVTAEELAAIRDLIMRRPEEEGLTIKKLKTYAFCAFLLGCIYDMVVYFMIQNNENNIEATYCKRVILYLFRNMMLTAVPLFQVVMVLP